MDKQVKNFLNREANVVEVTYIITRHTLPNGVEHLVYTPKDIEGEYFQHDRYVNPEKPPPPEGKPKNTGGKKPYLMVMTQEVEELRKQGVKNVDELIGFIMSLGTYIEWNTGRLIHKRSKKQLKYKDLQKIFPYGNRKLNRILTDLREYDLLFNTEEGYFISTRIIKKGKSKKKGANRDGL